MSAEARYKENFIFYTGTRLNYEVLTNDSEKKIFLRYLLGIPDLPLSMIADTVFIPLDFAIYSSEKSKEKQTESTVTVIKKAVEIMLSSISERNLQAFILENVDPEESQTSLFDMNLKKLDESDVSGLKQTLSTFLTDDFEKASYERGGRHYFKGRGYLLSFREVNGAWLLSTLSREESFE